jgi:hypothetical protein
MQSLCRICRKDCHRQSSSTDITTIHEGVLIHEMLSKTCPIDIDDPITQLFPQRVCHECLEVLTAAYNLQRVSVESDQFFRQTLFSDRLVVKSERHDDDDMPVKEEELELELFDRDSYEEPEIEMETENVAYLVPLPTTHGRHPQPFNARIAADSSSSAEPFYECDFCQIQLRPRSSMLRHLRHEHDPQLLPHHCNYCAARFKSDNKRELHEMVQHENDRRPSVIVCEYCGASGVWPEGMRRHLADEHDVDEKSTTVFGSCNREIFHPRPVDGNEYCGYEDTW